MPVIAFLRNVGGRTRGADYYSPWQQFGYSGTEEAKADERMGPRAHPHRQ